MYENKIARAMELAGTFHKNQRDKQGHPYVLHLMRVASAMDPKDWDAIALALLHDIVEDTIANLDDIEGWFGKDYRAVIDALTHRKGEPHDDYIGRVAKSRMATIIKLADLADNLREDRREGLDQETVDRLTTKYVKAQRILTDALHGFDNFVSMPRTFKRCAVCNNPVTPPMNKVVQIVKHPDEKGLYIVLCEEHKDYDLSKLEMTEHIYRERSTN